MHYLIVVEEVDSGCGAHVPDLPGCIAAGETKEEALFFIREAIEFHIEGLREVGEPVPAPISVARILEVSADGGTATRTEMSSTL